MEGLSAREIGAFGRHRHYHHVSAEAGVNITHFIDYSTCWKLIAVASIMRDVCFGQQHGILNERNMMMSAAVRGSDNLPCCVAP